MIRHVACLSLLLVYVADARCYTVSLNGTDCPLETARISAMPFNRVWPGHQRSLDQTRMAKFVQIDLADQARLSLKFDGKIPDIVRVLPMSRAGKVVKGDEELVIDLNSPEQFIIDFGTEAEPLHVFVDEPWRYEPCPDDIYFGPGEHDAGIISPKSGQRVVLDRGAVVYGALFAYKVNDIEVVGRGMLDSSRIGRQELSAREFRKQLGLPEYDTEYACGAFIVYGCENVKLTGFILRDTPFWAMIIRNGSKRVNVENVKIIGQWRYNSDGIDICASEDVSIRGCFLRTFDDCIVARGPYLEGENTPVRNMLVENCNLWCDWGKNMEVWAGHLPALIENITYRGNRLLNVAHIPADVTTWYGSTNTMIRNIVFEDIEIDLLPDRAWEVLQESDDHRFVAKTRTAQNLFEITAQRPAKNLNNQQHGYEGDFTAYRAKYDDILLKDFKMFGSPLPFTGVIKTYHPGQSIEKVKTIGLPDFEMIGNL